MNQRVIRVKGRGHVSVPPDCIELNMALRAVHLGYGEAMRMAAQSLEDIRAALEPEGLGRKDIRTTRFSASTEHEHKEDERGKEQRVFVGYAISNNLKTEIEQDSVRLGRVLSALANCPANPELSIYYCRLTANP